MKKTEPKFKVGQVVVMNDKKQTPFRVIEARWMDSWFYKWSNRSAAQENMLRELTPEEKGEK